MDKEKLKAEMRSKMILIALPVVIAIFAGGMFPSLIGVTEGFSVVGALVWGAIIGLLDYKMIDINNPSIFVKMFRFMLLILTATLTATIIDSAVLKKDIEEYKLTHPPVKSELIINKARCEMQIAEARRDCEKSGKRDCGTVCGTLIIGSGNPGAGPLAKALQDDVMYYRKAYDDALKASEGGLIYDLGVLHEVISQSNGAFFAWLFFMGIMIALEGIVLFLMHTESKTANATILEIDNGAEEDAKLSEIDIARKILEAQEKHISK